MIRIENVHVDYGVPPHRRKILNGIDVEVQAGEFVSIVGQTGCGKSTLLRLILGEEKPSRGRVLVDGSNDPNPIGTVATSRRNILSSPIRPR
jgi:NitT/TauT family transport system ATP-binding protein